MTDERAYTEAGKNLNLYNKIFPLQFRDRDPQISRNADFLEDVVRMPSQKWLEQMIDRIKIFRSKGREGYCQIWGSTFSLEGPLLVNYLYYGTFKRERVDEQVALLLPYLQEEWRYVEAYANTPDE